MATRRITSDHHRSRNRVVDSESIMKNLTKQLQERVDEFKAKLWELGLTSKDIDVDTLTAQTVQATKEWVKEIVEGEKRAYMTSDQYYSEDKGTNMAPIYNQALDDIKKKLDISIK